MHTLSIQATTPSKDKTPASIKKSCVRAPGAKSPTTPKKRKRQDMFAGTDMSPPSAAAPAVVAGSPGEQAEPQPSSSKGARPKSGKAASKSPKKGKPTAAAAKRQKDEEEEEEKEGEKEVKKVSTCNKEATKKEKRIRVISGSQENVLRGVPLVRQSTNKDNSPANQ